MNDIDKLVKNIQMATAVGYPLSQAETKFIDEALQEKAERENPKPLTVEQFENICREVHNGWWEEKKKQGVTNHPDMIPYSELSENVKEYDRVTVRRVLDAIGIAYLNKPKEG